MASFDALLPDEALLERGDWTGVFCGAAGMGGCCCRRRVLLTWSMLLSLHC